MMDRIGKKFQEAGAEIVLLRPCSFHDLKRRSGRGFGQATAGQVKLDAGLKRRQGESG